MGNYTKSFNFRNGVQVDDSNFIVNPNGLVGIGTSIPEKKLDVRGNAKIIGDTTLVGLASITDLNVVGVVTIGSIKVDSGSGIITATKFVGDASGLTNIVAIATDGFIANTGTLSTTAKVGIGSTQPTSQLDVLGDSKFVGVTTFTGITTSSDTLFANSFTSNTLVVNGISTFTGSVDANGGATIDNVQIGVSGDNKINTSSGNLTLDSAGGEIVVDDNLSVTGISAFTGNINANGNIVGDNSTNITGIDAISAASVTVSNVISTSAQFSGNINANGNIIGDGASQLSSFNTIAATIIGATSLRGLTGAGNKVFETVGTGATVYGKLDVARFAGGASGLSSHFGSLRYGNENDGESPYSTRRSLDLINTDSGNVNFYLNANNLSVPDSGSDFHWHKGFDNSRLMTLTGSTGRLGVGTTLPTFKLQVEGGSKITGVSTFSSDLFVGNNLNVKGALAVSIINANVTGNLTGNINAASGISTFSAIKTTDKTATNFAGVGIGTTVSNENYIETVNSVGLSTSKFIVNTEGKVAIGTDTIRDGIGLNAHKEKATFGAVGVGTTSPLAAVDFRDAGQDGTGASLNRMYMLPPTITENQRDSLAGVVPGAIVFVSDLLGGKLQVYVGSGWVSLH